MTTHPLDPLLALSAPANSLPTWGECQLRVSNSDYISKRVSEGGYGPEGDEKLATELHRFIYEYDDADPFRSAWFLHRLELLLNETKADAESYWKEMWRAANARADGVWIAFADRWPNESAALDDPSVKTTDTVLVTNNLHSRDRMGRMSHVWLLSPIRADGEVVGFTEANWKVHGLTHWQSFTPPTPVSEVRS